MRVEPGSAQLEEQIANGSQQMGEISHALLSNREQ